MVSTEIIGIIAGCFTTIAFIPQVYKTWASKSAKDISMHMFILFITGVTLWIIYGIIKNVPAVLISNVAIFILAGIQILLKIKYDRESKKFKESRK